MQYGNVTLPDSEIITELTSRGQLLRTDVNDQMCSNSAAKIGPDADERAGGCDNIRVVLTGASVQASVWHGAEP
jgi:hypothetical protein